MKFKCYDKYHKNHLIMELGYDDHIDINTTSSSKCWGNSRISFEINQETVDVGEDPHPERWSDLINWEVVK